MLPDYLSQPGGPEVIGLLIVLFVVLPAAAVTFAVTGTRRWHDRHHAGRFVVTCDHCRQDRNDAFDERMAARTRGER